MARDPQKLRKAYEYKLGKDLVAKLSDDQIASLSQYYNSLQPSQQSDVDSELVKGIGEFLNTARSMADPLKYPSDRSLLPTSEVRKYQPEDKSKDDFIEGVDKKLDEKLTETSDSIMNEIDKLIAEYQKKIDDYKKPQEEKVPEGLDDLLKDIRGEVGGEASKKGGALAVISKPDRTKQETLVGDDIDPEILSALGIGDATDLDYGEYSSLLKEKMVANQMGSGMGLDQGKLRDEFKRVRGKTGKFTVKNQKIKAETFVSNKKKPSSSARVVTPIPLLPGQVDEDIKPERQSFDKTIALLAGKLNSVDSNVRQTTENLQKKDAVETKQDEQDRIDAERTVNNERETRTERRNLLVGAVNGIKKTVKPVTDMLGGFFDFSKRLGFAVFILELLEFLQDPKKYLNGIIEFVNKQIEKLEKTIENFIVDKLVSPMNGVIDGFNQKVKEFVGFINPLLSKLKGLGIDAQLDAETMMIPNIDPDAIRKGFDLPSIPTIGGDGPKLTEEQKEIKLREQREATEAAMRGDPRMDPSAVQVEPQETMMGQPRPTSGGNNQQALLDTIAYAEGTEGSYGTIYGGAVVPELAAGELTVQEVLDMQKTGKVRGRDAGYKKDGYDSDATGRYQFMSYVLEEEIEKQGISLSEKFTPELQDRLILGRIARMRGVTAEMIEKEGLSENVIDRLAPEFASFPNLFGPDAQGRTGTNTSYYGQGGKTKEDLMQMYDQNLKKPSSDLPLQPSTDAQRQQKLRQQEEETRRLMQGDPRFTGAQSSLPPQLSPPVTATMTSIGGLGGGETPSANTTSSSDSQSRVIAFSASDPTNLSILAAKSVYRVV